MSAPGVNKKPKKFEDMSKEQIQQAILKKRECNAKAQQIVESLLEGSVTENYLLKCLVDINQSHFEDVIEERSITSLCGYPLCEKSISDKDIPKQKYRISVKTNKVYDITARKSFCSNCCYKAAMHIKKQMLTSPLWFREYEVIPKFYLLPPDTVGCLGQEVDLGLVEKINIKPKSQVFTSINDFTSCSLNEMGLQKDNLDVNVNKNESNENKDQAQVDLEQLSLQLLSNDSEDQKLLQNVTNTLEAIQLVKTDNKEDIVTKEKKQKNKINSNPMNIVGDIVERPAKDIDPIILSVTAKENQDSNKLTKKPTRKKQPSVTVITIEVEKCLAEWFTIDTILFLFGKEKVKEMVTDKGECITEYLNNYTKGIYYSSTSYDQYQALCRKLNLLELEDKKFDTQTMHRDTKPLPDYSIIREESKKLQLKVKAYLAGEMVVPEPEHTDEDSTEKVDETSSDNNSTKLPLVDKNAQNALRRRIVNQHLNKVLPDLLRSLNLLTLSVSSDVCLLVNTFKLQANNIMFKPIQWTLIAIVVIKLLSLRDERLKHLLEQPKAYEHMQLLLLSYKQDGGYLERLISWLTDIDRLLDTNDTQLTIE